MTTTYDCEIEQIVQSIFSTMLEMDLRRTDDVPPSDDDWLLAAVQIAGEWTGSVMLQLSAAVARESAAAMLQMPSSEVSDGDRRDVAAELVNMIGGNLKSLLPGPSFLSLPTIVSGRDIDVQVQDAEQVENVSLMSRAGPVFVRVYAKTSDLHS
jgi:chemotaxis protein CheX